MLVLIVVNSHVLYGQNIPPKVIEASKNVVRINLDNHLGGQDRGTGVYLGDLYVATCFHLFRGAPKIGTLVFQDGVSIPFKVNSGLNETDQAIIQLSRSHPTLNGVEISDKIPEKGELVYSIGLGMNRENKIRIFGGKILAFYKNSKSENDYPIYLGHESAAEEGDSGGPTFNEDGELYGCLKGFAERDKTNITLTSKPPIFNNFSRPLRNVILNWRNKRNGFRLIR